MGYILNGVYHRGEPDMNKLRTGVQSTYKEHEQNRQRKDFAREIVQPYKNGQPNQDFIQAWPEESKSYGFLPKEEDLRDGKN